MNNILCAIARNENLYINEWVRHHLKIGFSHIYLYDNNSKKDPYVGDFIDKELLDKVTIIDWRDRREIRLQLTAYQDCYDKNQFDWCAFWDVDEFLVGVDDINAWLSQDSLRDKEQIKVKITLFGDDDCLERDMSIPLMDFFKKPIIANQGKDPPLVKCLVKGGLQNLRINCCHYAERGMHQPLINCTPSGRQVLDGTLNMHIDPPDHYNGETIFLNHYITKTLKEFLDQKYKLCWVLMPYLTRGIEYFWYYNEKTPEKEQYFKNYIKEHNLPFIDNIKKFC